MAVRSSRAVIAALQAKGFRSTVKAKRTDHDYYTLYVGESKTLVWTKVSRGASHDVAHGLLSTMARQCKLTTPQFCDLVDCTLSGEDYLQILRDNKSIEV